ncbi:MAG: Gfo/Idh/MocA family oxidoreductase, partial [Caldilinea sp.]
MQESKLRVAVLGAGAWANFAHIPGWQRDPRCEVVAICDPVAERAQEFAARVNIPAASTDWQQIVGDPSIDVIDVCTPSATHFRLAWAGLEANKHVLCEKPVAFDYRETQRAAALARAKGLKTKLGFTFRYSPGVQYAKSLIDEGFTGRPFIFNGYEQ